MYKTVNEVINFIQTQKRLNPQTSRQRMQDALDEVKCDFRRLRVIHITGTNGKGSTSTYISNILKCAGYKVGLFTSPFVKSFNERIKLNSEDISDEDLIRITNTHLAIFEKYSMGFFEILTFIATVYYVEQRTDYCVMEVGIGGRYDSTNIFNNIVSLITNVSLDHTESLGKTLESILKEKAEIIKNNELCITAITDPELLPIINQKTDRVIVIGEPKYSGNILTKHGNTYELSMIGKHQKINASMAIECAEYLSIPYESIYQGIKETVMPARIEIISTNPLVIIDGAHNYDSMLKLAEAVIEEYPDREKVLVFGKLNRKELDFNDVLDMFDRIIVTAFNDPECAIPNELFTKINNPRKNVIEDLNLITSLIESDNSKCYIFAGSFRLATYVRDVLINKFQK